MSVSCLAALRGRGGGAPRHDHVQYMVKDATTNEARCGFKTLRLES